MKKLTQALALILILTTTLVMPAFADAVRPLIGIVQVNNHGALDATREGFLRALNEHGYTDGHNMTIDYRNAQGNQDTLSSIADYYVGMQVDLILAITTASALAVASKTETIPVLGAAITDYVEAKLVQSNEHPGGNISGTPDMNPVDEQIGLIARLVPDAKTVGLIYDSSEVNSRLQVREAKAELEKLGLAWKEITVNNSNDVYQAVNTIIQECDALYIPTDNTLASAMPTVYEAALAAMVPVVAGDGNMVMQGGNFTLGIDYELLGYQTGLMALSVLRDGADVSLMPIEHQSVYQYYVNKTACDAMGIDIPADLLAYAREMQGATASPEP
ncbi:MAG: ABC transporter substrate-binding protein [Clostridiales bacterium]|nr:ABC transporter substrate-binding protein [Clostridiales bacterium]